MQLAEREVRIPLGPGRSLSSATPEAPKFATQVLVGDQCGSGDPGADSVVPVVVAADEEQREAMEAFHVAARVRDRAKGEPRVHAPSGMDGKIDHGRVRLEDERLGHHFVGLNYVNLPSEGAQLVGASSAGGFVGND